jgi:hypothetical protein
VPFSTEDRKFIRTLAKQYQLNESAVEALFTAVEQGNGRAAQFNHPDLGGMGQWMADGMVMVGDMFNHRLKATVADLCQAIAAYLHDRSEPATSSTRKKRPPQPSSVNWWPAEFGSPTASGSQNTMHYAYFARPRRLAIRLGDAVIIYDAKDHQISGVSQQQDRKQTLVFRSQKGEIELSKLPKVREYTLS